MVKSAFYKKLLQIIKNESKRCVQSDETLLSEMKELQRENESLTAKLAHIEAGNLLRKVKRSNGIKVLTSKVQAADMNTLRNMADDLKQKLGSGIIVLGSARRIK